jgi:nicotinate-nucleotide adenylyltransferase
MILAVYGGSFDPPHVAHTLVCAYVLSTQRVDRVLVLPAARHPFDKPLTPFEHRVRMCELAFRDLRRVEICTVAAELPGPGYTLHILEELKRRYPDAQLRLVVGSDILSETRAWHRFDLVERLAPLIVIERAGHESGHGAFVLPDVSSSEARRSLRAGESTEGRLDPHVEAYARAHGLYV